MPKQGPEHQQRDQAELLIFMTRRVVAYRLAMVQALYSLTPGQCPSCRQARAHLEAVDLLP